MATVLTQTTKKKSNEQFTLSPVNLPNLTAAENSAINDVFPLVDPGFVPNGNRVLIQVRRPKTKTKGGLLMPDSAIESQIYEEQVGRVVAIGQAAFRNPADMSKWAEDPWFEVGDFVRFPKFGGDKTWTVTPDGEKTLFIVFREYDTIGRIYCNPLDIKGAF